MIFAPGQGGGQVEVLNANPYLLYNGIPDAVAKIDKILKDDVLREKVRQEMIEYTRRFSSKAFVERIQDAVKSFN